MSYELTNIPKAEGKNPPGMADTILMCRRQEVLTFPPSISPVVNPGDSLRLDGDITFDTGDGWVEVYATQDTVETLLKKVGQKDSRGFNAEIPFFHPSLSAAFLELLVEDPDLIFAVKRSGCNGTEYIIFGDDCRSLKLMGDYGSGKSDDESGRNGTEAMASGYIPNPWFYNGTITLKP